MMIEGSASLFHAEVPRIEHEHDDEHEHDALNPTVKASPADYLIVAVLLLSNVSATLTMITNPRMLCWK